LAIAWSGLADSKYYNYIAKYCLPSWAKLPGDKFIVHDSHDIEDFNLNIIKWQNVYNKNNTFTKKCQRTKPINFWRKMQSQIWALNNLVGYDFVILLDTDVEILNFNTTEFLDILQILKNQDLIWATGESQKNKLDAGHIIVNMKHDLLKNLIFDYENIWESGEIFNFTRQYDGQAVEFLLEKYPSYKIKNIDHGGGLHTYNLGTVHYGSKVPKLLRACYGNFSENIVNDIINEKNQFTTKKYSLSEIEQILNERNKS
jgi:hypothetical protein